MTQISVIHGPNLNLVGKSETRYYGTKDLEAINKEIADAFAGKVSFSFFQSNHEGGIIDKIHETANCAGIVINPGAYTHTSYAIRDALTAVETPAIEVHISNVYARESFRHHSVISEVCVGVIAGLGSLGYHAAVDALLQRIKK